MSLYKQTRRRDSLKDGTRSIRTTSYLSLAVSLLNSVMISNHHITGVEGIEPPITESKSGALPFGYTP